jgi:hypothetical protein
MSHCVETSSSRYGNQFEPFLKIQKIASRAYKTKTFTMVLPSRGSTTGSLSPRLFQSRQRCCQSVLLPLVYISIGFFLCASLFNHPNGEPTTTRSLLLAWNNNNKADDAAEPSSDSADGWTTIQVFKGIPPRQLSDTNNEATTPQQFYSQARQDELVVALLRQQPTQQGGAARGYFFIDLAANDATLLSNTVALERSYNWTGLCIEPNPLYWYNLTMQRTCQVIGAVVGGTQSSSRNEAVYFRMEAGDHGGIAGDGFDNGKRWQKNSQIMYTVPLLEIFQRNNVPKVIDYLSLDVEGAETFIMLGFPLNEYKIKIITAERLKGEIRRYLKEHGYEFVKRLSHFGESLWVHSDYMAELDMGAVERFDFPINAETVASVT